MLSSISYNKVIQFTDSADAIAGEIGFNSAGDTIFRIINEASTSFAFQSSSLNILNISNTGSATIIGAPSGDSLTLNGSAGVNFVNITGSNTVSNLDFQVGNNSGDRNLDVRGGGSPNSKRIRMFSGGTEVFRISEFGTGVVFGINSGTSVFDWNTAGSLMTMNADLNLNSNDIDNVNNIIVINTFELEGVAGTRRTLLEEQDATGNSLFRISQRTSGGISQGTFDIELNGTSNFCDISTDRTSGFLFNEDITTTTGIITSNGDMTLRRGGSTTVSQSRSQQDRPRLFGLKEPNHF